MFYILEIFCICSSSKQWHLFYWKSRIAAQFWLPGGFEVLEIQTWKSLKGFFDLFFVKKISENPFKFVEGIILDDDVPARKSDMANDFSGFDLVMGLGSTSEDTGLDLVRGNNESSDDEDENRRLRKLNQDSLTTVKKIRSSKFELLKYFEIFFWIFNWLIFIFCVSRKVVVIGETDVRIQCVLSIELEIFWIKWLIVSSIRCRTRLNGNGKDSLKIPKILSFSSTSRQPVFSIFRGVNCDQNY